MRTINIHEARTHLSRLVEQTANGEPFVIAKSGKPLVKVTAVDAPAAGQIRRLVSWPARYPSLTISTGWEAARSNACLVRTHEIPAGYSLARVGWGQPERLAPHARRLLDDPSNEPIFSVASHHVVAIDALPPIHKPGRSERFEREREPLYLPVLPR